ncbi:MAG: winged helix-turn-helix transcriptional regulator [Hyphomicrobiales bacterium]|jgi:DNA-binding transcriptional ArsR family regulator|nr:winged helix-turn-helix transcriptional regulator [Hyphomicrobiales bacterium]
MADTDIFRALADPTRRAVFERLVKAEKTVSELRSDMPVSQPAISQHLAVLRDAGLVTERREGRFSYYRIAPQALTPLADWVERYRTFWPDRVEMLKQTLKEMEP